MINKDIRGHSRVTAPGCAQIFLSSGHLISSLYMGSWAFFKLSVKNFIFIPQWRPWAQVVTKPEVETDMLQRWDGTTVGTVWTRRAVRTCRSKCVSLAPAVYSTFEPPHQVPTSGLEYKANVEAWETAVHGGSAWAGLQTHCNLANKFPQCDF